MDTGDEIQWQVFARRISRTGELDQWSGSATRPRPAASTRSRSHRTAWPRSCTSSASPSVRARRSWCACGPTAALASARPPLLRPPPHPVVSRSGYVAFALSDPDLTARAVRVAPDGQIRMRGLTPDLAGDDGIADVGVDRHGNVYAVVARHDWNRAWVRTWRRYGSLGGPAGSLRPGSGPVRADPDRPGRRLSGAVSRYHEDHSLRSPAGGGQDGSASPPLGEMDGPTSSPSSSRAGAPPSMTTATLSWRGRSSPRRRRRTAARHPRHPIRPIHRRSRPRTRRQHIHDDDPGGPPLPHLLPQRPLRRQSPPPHPRLTREIGSRPRQVPEHPLPGGPRADRPGRGRQDHEREAACRRPVGQPARPAGRGHRHPRPQSPYRWRGGGVLFALDAGPWLVRRRRRRTPPPDRPVMTGTPGWSSSVGCTDIQDRKVESSYSRLRPETRPQLRNQDVIRHNLPAKKAFVTMRGKPCHAVQPCCSPQRLRCRLPH